MICSSKIKHLPDSAYYISNFITPVEEQRLLDKIYSCPKPKWKTLSNRRLQNWGGLPHPKGMIQEDMPEWLTRCIQQVVQLEIFGDNSPNHVLVNEYLPGQGIMPHEDGPLFYPTIATINLGSHTVLDYYEKSSEDDQNQTDNQSLNNNYIGSVLLERCSLLIVQDSLYSQHLHGIKENSEDFLNEKIKNLEMCNAQLGSKLSRETRISLTIRHVPHTIKSKLIFGIK